jgi:hypothetical protein
VLPCGLESIDSGAGSVVDQRSSNQRRRSGRAFRNAAEAGSAADQGTNSQRRQSKWRVPGHCRGRVGGRSRLERSPTAKRVACPGMLPRPGRRPIKVRAISDGGTGGALRDTAEAGRHLGRRSRVVGVRVRSQSESGASRTVLVAAVGGGQHPAGCDHIGRLGSGPSCRLLIGLPLVVTLGRSCRNRVGPLRRPRSAGRRLDGIDGTHWRDCGRGVEERLATGSWAHRLRSRPRIRGRASGLGSRTSGAGPAAGSAFTARSTARSSVSRAAACTIGRRPAPSIEARAVGIASGARSRVAVRTRTHCRYRHCLFTSFLRRLRLPPPAISCSCTAPHCMRTSGHAVALAHAASVTVHCCASTRRSGGCAVVGSALLYWRAVVMGHCRLDAQRLTTALAAVSAFAA